MKSYKLIGVIIFCIVLFSESSSVCATNETLLLAIATSVDSTGLLDYLVPHFTKDTEIELKWLVAGSDKVLQLGEKCNAEVLLVHSPKLEMEYLKNASCVERAEVMYNNFMLVGPDSDIANIEGMDILTALLRIKETNSPFISRGDNSGTHICETDLWKAITARPTVDEPWYTETKEGMLATVNFCAKIGGYTIVDEGTYFKYMDNFDDITPLKIFIKGGEKLKNNYSVLLVNPKNCPNRNFENAASFFEWIIGDTAQNLIKNFNLKGNYLFIPNAR